MDPLFLVWNYILIEFRKNNMHFNKFYRKIIFSKCKKSIKENDSSIWPRIWNLKVLRNYDKLQNVKVVSGYTFMVIKKEFERFTVRVSETQDVHYWKRLLFSDREECKGTAMKVGEEMNYVHCQRTQTVVCE